MDFKFKLFVFSFLSGIIASSYGAPADYDLTREAGDIKGLITLCGQAEIDVKVYAPGTSFSATTDGGGNFRLSYVQEGTYDLIVKKGGKSLGTVSQVTVVKKQTVDIGTTNFCTDSDGDGFSPPEDCNDSNPNINPGATEECDGIDNDCDGSTDNDPSCTVCTDADVDGFFAQDGCGTVVDCDDNDPSINPDAIESCDSIDNNCNGEVDEDGADPTSWYLDRDKDTFGDDAYGGLFCSPPNNHVSQPGDCDDANDSVYPGAPEVCDDTDNNCDGRVDEDFNGTDWNGDELSIGDSCGTGACSGGFFQCSSTAGAACDTEHLSTLEVCDNGLDDDCDGETDEGCKSLP